MAAAVVVPRPRSGIACALDVGQTLSVGEDLPGQPIELPKLVPERPEEDALDPHRSVAVDERRTVGRWPDGQEIG